MESILERKSEDICKDILKQIRNDSVKVELDDTSSTSLYVFLTNTIYIANKKIKSKRSVEEQNKSKLLVIAHECAHSIQSKIMQFINFVLSNLEILLFLTVLFIKFVLKNHSPILTYIYVGVFIFSILVRHYLEMDATINSVKIVTKYLLSAKIEKEKIINLTKYYKKELIKALPLFLLSLYITKIARLIIVLLI